MAIFHRTWKIHVTKLTNSWILIKLKIPLINFFVIKSFLSVHYGTKLAVSLVTEGGCVLPSFCPAIDLNIASLILLETAWKVSHQASPTWKILWTSIVFLRVCCFIEIFLVLLVLQHLLLDASLWEPSSDPDSPCLSFFLCQKFISIKPIADD